MTQRLTGRKQKVIDIIFRKLEKINEAMITKGAKTNKKVRVLREEQFLCSRFSYDGNLKEKLQAGCRVYEHYNSYANLVEY